MPDLYIKKEKTTLYRVTEAAFLFAIGLYILIEDLTKTTLHLDLPRRKYFYLAVLLAATGIVRLADLLVEDREHLKIWAKYLAAALVIDAVYFMIYRENHVKVAAFLAIMTLGSIGVHYVKILKVYSVAAATVIFSAILMSWMGATDNFVFLSDMTVRSSWGIKYPTDLMSLLFFLFLATWIVFKEKDDLWFLIPGGILMAMSCFVAYSRTGMLCNLLLLITLVLHRFLARSKEGKLHRFIDICTCAAFPFFSALTLGLFAAFLKGSPFAKKADVLMSYRLTETSKVLNEYGIGFFGKSIPQKGWGGSTFATKEYSFVDISYLLILIQFGIVAFIMINILWVLMTRHAIIIGDRRLALSMALIAFNAASEHHITQINYNVLIAVPFAVLAVKKATDIEPLPEPAGIPQGKATKAATVIAILSIAAIAIISLIPEGRTIAALLKLGSNAHRKALLFTVCAVALWLTIAAIISAYKLCAGRIDRRNSGFALDGNNHTKLYIAIIAVFVIASAVTIVAGSGVIREGVDDNKKLVSSEQDAINIITETGTSKLYVTDLPSLYEEDEEDVIAALFKGEDLARFEHTSIIIDKYLDSPILFAEGFYYTEISDEHALLTNDPDTMEAMEKAGYQFTNYFPLLMTVDMKYMAEKNGLKLEPDGTIILHGDTEKLKKGPRVDLRAGLYTITYDITCISKDPNSTMLCTLRARGRKGKDLLQVTEIAADQVDIGSRSKLTMMVNITDEKDVDFRLAPAGSSIIKIYGITYQKTPE